MWALLGWVSVRADGWRLAADAQVKAATARGKVYSMAFVGINGVGKSTSLAKVAYYLKENGVKVRAEGRDRPGSCERMALAV